MTLFCTVWDWFMRSRTGVLRSRTGVLRSRTGVWTAVPASGRLYGHLDGCTGIWDLDIPMGWALAIPTRNTHGVLPTTPGTPLHRTTHCTEPAMTGCSTDLNAYSFLSKLSLVDIRFTVAWKHVRNRPPTRHTPVRETCLNVPTFLIERVSMRFLN